MEYHLLVTLPVFLLLHTGLALTFRKAGKPWWAGLIPLYNIHVWLQLVKRPKWWLIFYVIPVLNFIMGIGIILDLIKSFGKQRFIDHCLAVIFPYFYFIYLGLNKDKYLGKMENEAKKGTVREWLDAILFAGVAALAIRTFLLEAFMIPTTSMEGSLLAGDFLFVSKVHYGVRMPMAPLSVPFVHNTMPLTKSTKSYLDWITLPYSRLPALKDVERNEIVVFNYPDDDVNPDVEALGQIGIISMKQNYIKRCVAVPGDLLEIKAGTLHINGQPAWKAENLQTSYFVSGVGPRVLEKKGFRIAPNNNYNAEPAGNGVYLLNMNEKMMNEIAAMPGVKVLPEIDNLDDMAPQDRETHKLQEMACVSGNPLSLDPRMPKPKNAIFPKHPDRVLWTRDDFGPLWIPKEGAQIPLNDSTLTFYEKCITIYEGHKLERRDGKYFIDGAESKTYTFGMDYYWMMGDNRHQSLDSRYWGFVPEDHIVGRPWFVLFSWEGGPRWNRFFRPATKWEP
ncbi:MAG: signal peptidase I [Bacteroidia bacterium]